MILASNTKSTTQSEEYDEICSKKALAVISDLFNNLGDEKLALVDADRTQKALCFILIFLVQLGLNDLFMKIEKEEVQIRKINAPDNEKLVVSNSYVEAFFSTYKFYELKDYSSSNSHLKLKAMIKIKLRQYS